MPFIEKILLRKHKIWVQSSDCHRKEKHLYPRNRLFCRDFWVFSANSPFLHANVAVSFDCRKVSDSTEACLFIPRNSVHSEDFLRWLTVQQRGRRRSVTEEIFISVFANRTEQNVLYNGLFVKFMKLFLRLSLTLCVILPRECLA